MLYRQRTNKLKKLFSLKNSIIIFFVILIILIGIINPSLIIKPLQSIALSSALVKNNIESNISNVFSLFRSKEKLTEENQTLNKQYSTLSTFCALSIKSLKNKQGELEKSLGRKNTSLKNYIGTGYVIAKPPIVPYGTITIDLGDKSGVKIGNQAIVGEHLVGVISDVLNDRAIIKLYGEKDENILMLVGTKRLLLSGQGIGFGTFKAKVVNETEISAGENVWLSNAPNYLFGNVIFTNQSSNNQYQDLVVKSPISIFEISSVDIVSN